MINHTIIDILLILKNMGELIKGDFRKNIENVGQVPEEKDKISLIELYNKITATRMTSDLVSSFGEIVKPYTYEELLEFMQEVTKETIPETKGAFVKAVVKEIKHKLKDGSPNV